MPSLQLIGQNILIGFVNSSIYVVVALGITLLFGVSRIINLAHGEIFAIGGYITFVSVATLGIHPLISLFISIVLAFPLGWLLDRVLVAPLRRRPDIEMPLEFFLIMTLGLSIFLQNSLLAIYGDNYLKTPAVVGGRFSFPGGLGLSNQRLLIFVIALLIVVGLFLFLYRTKIGTAIRATSQNRTAAQSVGIDVQRLDSLVFGIAAALAAGAGSLVTPILFVYPSVGAEWTIKGVIVVIMGGLGNPIGTLLAAFILGIMEAIAVAFIPAQFKTVVGLLIMVTVLVFRPTGLMGRRLDLEI